MDDIAPIKAKLHSDKTKAPQRNVYRVKALGTRCKRNLRKYYFSEIITENLNNFQIKFLLLIHLGQYLLSSTLQRNVMNMPPPSNITFPIWGITLNL